MKSHSEMLSLGVAKIKQVYSKVVKKKIWSILICSQSKALSSVAFVNFLYAHWSSIYDFGPLLQEENSISSLHSEPRKELIEQRTVRSGCLFFQLPAAPAPNKAVVLQRPKGCVHPHPAAPDPSCLKRRGAGRLVPSCSGNADLPWGATTCAGVGRTLVWSRRQPSKSGVPRRGRSCSRVSNEYHVTCFFS